MSNLLEIYNENFGTQVATNGTYVVVGNPNSKPYNCTEGLSRIGEVLVYKKNKFNTTYSLKKRYTFKNPCSGNPYYTEQSSSLSFTASISTEKSGSYLGYSDVLFEPCSNYSVEDGTTSALENGYGKSLSICEKFLAIGNMSYTESINKSLSSGSSVDVYRLYYPNTNASCEISNDNFIFPSCPSFRISGSSYEQFGTSISISNNYVAISSPNALNGKGNVKIYKFISDEYGYQLQATLTSSDSNQRFFGHSISLNKSNESTLAIGTLTLSESKVFIFQRNESNWNLKQILEQDVSEKWLFIEGTNDMNFYPADDESQKYTKYGFSVSIADDALIVGAPNDLIYYEYSGSKTLRSRGAFYFYNRDFGSNEFVLHKKIYGNSETFKDNLMGYSVDVNKNYFLIGSPKPNFPFSSLYLSSSINSYNLNYKLNDLGSDTYHGQSLLYKYTIDKCGIKISDPNVISFRKHLGESFTAFGYSVAVSDENLVVGSPAPLLDDYYANVPYVLEESSSVDGTCITDELTLVSFALEDIICDCSSENFNSKTGSIIYSFDDRTLFELTGRAFIYDFRDLQTNPVVGNVFYNNNKFIVHNTGSILKDILKNPRNILEDHIYGSYQSQVTLNEKQYICTVEPGEFNISTNNTAVTSSFFEYNIKNKEKFTFNNLDLILRYINCNLTTNRKESWWNVLVTDETQNSIFGFYTSSMQNYKDNKLTDDLKCQLSTKNFDVNNDGVVDYSDAFLIWNYYINNLNITNYKQYLSPISRRIEFNDIINFLDKKTGKGYGYEVKPIFFEYGYSSSFDPTGSYLSPYITTVGLYSGADLVAVAKLAHPIKNNSEIPINIVVKWDT